MEEYVVEEFKIKVIGLVVGRSPLFKRGVLNRSVQNLDDESLKSESAIVSVYGGGDS